MGCFIVDESNNSSLRFCSESVFAFDCVLVIPETVGQYTGLTDKNGKKIFEGDILPVWENGEEYHYKVIYNGDCFMLAMLDSEQGSYPLSTKNTISEIIGNIHDNLELKKGRCRQWLS